MLKAAAATMTGARSNPRSERSREWSPAHQAGQRVKVSVLLLRVLLLVSSPLLLKVAYRFNWNDMESSVSVNGGSQRSAAYSTAWYTAHTQDGRAAQHTAQEASFWGANHYF